MEPTKGGNSLPSEPTPSYGSLLLVAGLAFLVPVFLARFPRLRVPVVVGEILAGIPFGRSGLGWIGEDPWLDLLSNLGFTYLLFLSGLEVDFGLLRALRSGGGSSSLRTFGLPLLYFALVLGGAVAASSLLTAWGLVKTPWLMALILSTTSLGVVLPVLRERKLSATPLGQSILLAALLVDFGTMLLLTFAVALEQGGPSIQVFLVLLLFVAFFLAHRLLRVLPGRAVFQEVSSATAQLGVRGTFLLIFVFVALAEQIGVEVVLGAFLAGAIVSLAAGRAQGAALREKLDAIGFGFVVPIFFINVGARFDLPALLGSAGSMLLAPLLLALLYVVKLVPAAIYRAAFPSWREVWAAGLLLSPGLTLMIAMSDIGVRTGLVGHTMNSAITLLAILSSVLSPILFERVLPASSAPGKRLLTIVGADEQSLMLARQVGDGLFDQVRLLEVDPQRARPAAAMGFDVVEADATQEEGLRAAGVDSNTVLVVATRADSVNFRVAQVARERLQVENVIAMASSVEGAERLRRLGVRAVTPALSTLVVLRQLVRDPDFFALLTGDDVEVCEAVVRSPAVAGRAIRELSLPRDVLILSIHRGREHLIPRGSTRLEPGDRVSLLGDPAALHAARDQLQGSS